jgi:hypothetical protein
MVRSLLFLSITLLLAFAGVSDPASAGASKSAATPSDLCLDAIAHAEQHQATPLGLLAVIAKVESGRPTQSGGLQPWPWTIDADGQGIFFASKEQAIAWSKQALDSGSVTFLDVGCMQIDLRMHPAAFRSLDDAFDPNANAEYGARYLRQLHDGIAGGNWYTAVGFYHSQTPELAALYRQQVAAVALGLSPPAMPSGHLARMRLDLVGGGVMRINVNRQPARVHRHLSACQIDAILGWYMPRRVAGCASVH